MKKLARNTLALGTATLIVTAGLSFSANGADATKSYSTGRFLSGSIGSTNLDRLAQLKGVSATNPGDPGANKNPLSLTLLSALPIDIPGGISLDVAKLLSPSGSAGAITQYASAESTSKSIGASGAVSDSGAVLATNGGVPTDAKVSISNGPLAGINDKLASVDLGVGALSSNTTVDKGNPTRSYGIAGLNLQVGVPLIGQLVGNLTTAIAPVAASNNLSISPADLCSISSTGLNVTTATLIAQLNTLTAGLGDTVGGLLSGLSLNQINLCDRTSNPLLGPVFALLTEDVVADLIKVEVTGLNDLTTGISNFSSGGVDVNLNTGKITLDLGQILDAAGVNLNKLPPNTDILQYVTSGLISQKITTVLDKVVSDLATNLGKVNIKISVAGTALPLQLTDVTTPAFQALTQALTAAATAVNQVGQPIDALLAQLVPNLNQIVKLTGNNQSTSKTPTLGTGTVQAGSFGTAAVGDYYRTSALKIDLLSNVLNLDLAASEAATLAADVVDGQDDGPPVNNDDNSDAPADNAAAADDSDSGNGNDADTVADADAQADADVTTTLPSTGAPNLLPFWLLGIALLLFGGAVLVNEKRRLNAQI